MTAKHLLALALAWAALTGCDRNVEPFVPGEKPRTPDLSKIFPAGAERVARGSAAAAGSARGMGGAVADGSGEPIEGRVELAEGLTGRIPDGAVLFVIVRHGTVGPPLAVKRISSPEFPVEFEVGPDDRMIQTLPFQGPLQVTARIDADGNATTREPGDLQGELPDPVDPGAQGLTVTINEIL